jgi:two-component system KDP operon response regulator KdpE
MSAATVSSRPANRNAWAAAAHPVVYVGHLRNKLEPEPAKPKLLLTEPGVGYRLKVQ